MPRPRARSLFELGGQWIAEKPGRPGLYRFWNDPRTGRQCRESLGTTNLEDAKIRLAEIVIKGSPKTADSHLSLVLEDYYTKRTDHLASAKPARHAGHLFLECWGALAKVSEITEVRQEEFVHWSIKRGNSLGYIARNMGVLAAALHHASIPVRVIHRAGEIQQKWPIKAKPERQIFIPTDAELARVLRATMPENLRRWLLNAMATGGRPEAVLQLSPASRRRDAPLIDLNPPGRRQNKKYRAIVRIPASHLRRLDQWEKADAANTEKRPEGRYCGYASVDSLDTALWRVCARDDVNLPRMAVYSIRHKVTSILRAAKVPSEQISYQIGHRRPEERTTRTYGEYDPRYLAEAASAIDAWMRRILKAAAHEKPKPRIAA